MGAEPDGDALHPHARLRAARLRHRALRRRDPDLPRDRDRRRADAPHPPARLRPRRAGSSLPLAEPALLRLRAREDERLDDRADPGRDADLRRADRARVRARAALTPVLDRGRGLVRRRRARRRRLERRLLRRPARRPARNRHRGDVGRLLGRDRAADAAVLGLADQRGRALARVGADRARRLPAGGRAGLRRRLGGVALARVRDARPARAHEPALVPRPAPNRCVARDARCQPAAVSSQRSSRSSSSRRG